MRNRAKLAQLAQVAQGRRDKVEERERELERRDAMKWRLEYEPGWRLDRMGRPFKAGA